MGLFGKSKKKSDDLSKLSKFAEENLELEDMVEGIKAMYYCKKGCGIVFYFNHRGKCPKCGGPLTSAVKDS